MSHSKLRETKSHHKGTAAEGGTDSESDNSEEYGDFSISLTGNQTETQTPGRYDVYDSDSSEEEAADPEPEPFRSLSMWMLTGSHDDEQDDDQQEPTTQSPQASPHREVAMLIASRDLKNERLSAQMAE